MLLGGGGKIYIGSKKSTYHRAVPGQNLPGLDDNWKVSADLPGWCNDYPKIISNKGLWPDIVLFSKGNSKVILVELTIPFESRLEQSHVDKTSKYEDLIKELENFYISPSDVDLSECFNGASCQWWGGGRCANKTVERKAPKRCTFSPDDPKTSMVEIRMAKGPFSIRSLFGEFLLFGK